MAAPRLEALPFKEAIDSFRAKGYRETFDYQEMMGEEHAYSFTVAKAMQRDVLQDIRGAIDDALSQGMTLQQFREGLKPKLQEKGWWGIKTMTDPATGEQRDVRLGTPRRLKTIYETNLRTAYAAGRWEQVQRTKEFFPYLRYVAVLDGHERPEHRALHNTIKPVDDPFWKQYYPPNGWGCRCTVQQVNEDDIKRLGLSVTGYDPSMPDRRVMNTRTGQVMQVPQGIDAGFDYNVGQARMKALTPPPLDRPLERRYSGPPAAVAPPAPRSFERQRLLPDGLKDEDYVRSFLKEFGADVGNPKMFKDVTGEHMVISDDLFKTAQGDWKITKSLRHQHLPLLVETIRDPDEIWELWEEYPKGRATLTRRYISRFDVDGEDAPGFALFDTSSDGWSGVTAFKADRNSYVNKQRRGSLVYRRPDKK